MALLRPCATSAGFTATPDKPVRLDMARLKQALQAAGFAILVDARIILVVRGPDGVEASLYDDGRVLLKTTDRAGAESVYSMLEPFLKPDGRPGEGSSFDRATI